MTDLNLDAIEVQIVTGRTFLSDEQCLALVAEVRRLRERTEAHAVTIQQAVSVERQRDEARAEAQRATAWHMEALDDLARAVCALDTSKAIASERRARVNRLVEAVERERAERLALTALLNAKQSWIDGAKVDLDGYDEARAERNAYLAALAAIASMPSASIAVRDVARHALLNGGAS